MPTAKRQRSPRVALCAAITFDGKLDTATPLPPAFWDFLALTDGDRFLADAAASAALPPEWADRVTVVSSGGAARTVGAWRDADPLARRVLCPGGPRIFRALLDAALVNDLHLLVRPRIDGRRDAPTLTGPFTPEFLPRSISLRLRRMEVLGGECLLLYTVARPRTVAPSDR